MSELLTRLRPASTRNSRRVAALVCAAVVLVCGALAWLPARRAEAITVTGVFVVGASVNMRCAIAIVPMSFGNYFPPNFTAHDAQGRITVACSQVTPNLQVRLDQGLNPAGSAAAPVRFMAHTVTSELLSYQLYRNAARSQVWAATTPTAVQPGPGPYPIDLPVYGRIPARQFVTSGAYTDTVLVTLLF